MCCSDQHVHLKTFILELTKAVLNLQTIHSKIFYGTMTVYIMLFYLVLDKRSLLKHKTKNKIE